MALVLGWPLTGVAIYLAYILGGLVAVVAVVTRLLPRDAKIPFAPALAAGLLGALWMGEALLRVIGAGG